MVLTTFDEAIMNLLLALTLQSYRTKKMMPEIVLLL